MKLILYTGGKGDAHEKIVAQIAPIVPEKDLDIYQEIDDLIKRLKRPKYDISIIVLVATRQNLSLFLTFRDLLMDQRIILILPDREKETMTSAFKLYPRFFTTLDGDFNILQAVLNKMLGKTVKQSHQY